MLVVFQTFFIFTQLLNVITKPPYLKFDCEIPIEKEFQG